MYAFYSLLLACAALLSLPWWTVQMLRLGKYRSGLAERLGFVPARLSDAKAGSIWVHAVSVGEVLAVSHLIDELQRQHPERQIFVSTTTATGQNLARQRFGENRVFFMPLDFGFAVRRYLNALRPQLIVIAETEFWPNLLHLAGKRQTSLAIVNARISDRSFPRYLRFKWFFGRVLSEVDLFLAQTAEDAQRLREIGVPTERVRVSGNLKFDIRPNTQPSLVNGLHAAIRKDSPVIVCGSTAEGEEEPLLAAFQEVRQQFPGAVMVLAPRHPERFEKVAALISAKGLAVQRRSLWTPPHPINNGGIFLLDSVGELAAIYERADIAFVGGSLVPTGGHNVLEPAQYGAAIVVGPHTFNFREIVSIFEQGGAVSVVSAETVGQQFLSLLSHSEERQQMGRRAKDLFAKHAGATRRTLDALAPLLKQQERGQ
ncbi:MAG TPA: 3-deoxy-D-manno-octulosonic acid transferase [Candidatus Angelobacter sp.]|jgi:3-deoxy-D-manno-octulosonic-acid transferase|nr:3-deoxy-D-manno-octulosonic acid transferase [Candidatus Angelobacter sp.]